MIQKFHESHASSILDHQTLNLVLQVADGGSQVRSLVGGDAAGDHSTRDTGSTTESNLAGNVDIRNVLVLAQQGQVQNDRQRSGVGGQDDDLGGSAVEGLGGLVGTLLQLAVVAGLLDEVEQGLSEALIGDGPGWRVLACFIGALMGRCEVLTSGSVFGHFWRFSGTRSLRYGSRKGSQPCGQRNRWVGYGLVGFFRGNFLRRE